MREDAIRAEFLRGIPENSKEQLKNISIKVDVKDRRLFNDPAIHKSSYYRHGMDELDKSIISPLRVALKKSKERHEKTVKDAVAHGLDEEMWGERMKNKTDWFELKKDEEMLPVIFGLGDVHDWYWENYAKAIDADTDALGWHLHESGVILNPQKAERFKNKTEGRRARRALKELQEKQEKYKRMEEQEKEEKAEREKSQPRIKEIVPVRQVQTFKTIADEEHEERERKSTDERARQEKYRQIEEQGKADRRAREEREQEKTKQEREAKTLSKKRTDKQKQEFQKMQEKIASKRGKK